MKKNSFFVSLLSVGVMFTACSSDDPDFNPNTETEETQTVTFEGDYWNTLIDSPQYGGPLLYGLDARNYGWCDVATQLTGFMSNAWGGTYGFAEGGSAISNYIDENIGEACSYDVQLAVPVSNGSQNFVVVYCDASLRFADGVAREIVSMDVIGTTYLMSVIKNGDGYAKALLDNGDYLNVIVTGYNGETETGSKKISFAQDGAFLDGWYKADLSSLGKVTSISFTMESNDISDWGMKAPKYFAFDNVVIKK